ncbi:acyl--CoA ligase [Paenibacillus polymyxa]|uniref:acyl-CoA synthetase n=1 Tax=Paenibacillus polymyxa TaxID=1406 RepID=UPI00042E984D|nr:acyl--CoA ligase [Paenibacillus polymyxa]AHM66013.1 AMP-dependent synthetase/ligase [Paenibacillus polymyxa SQR-21]AIY11478.1 acyl--CoA ligase [Paenibacillus polymyxa]UMR37961.1 acyl--CoA ligase [Paenibacillus polymyxa]
MTDQQQWLAPEYYNMTSEMEHHEAGKTALKWLSETGGYEEITYGELLKKANRLAGGLASLGFNKGDRVLVVVPRRIIAYVIYLACLKLGLAVIPSSEMLRAKDIAYRLRHSEARAVIAWTGVTGEVDKISDDLPALAHRIVVPGDHTANAPGWLVLDELMEGQEDIFEAVKTHRDDMAILAYTSGTTGNPKAVVHSHGWGYAHLRITSPWLDIQASDIVWATAAPGWQKWIWSPFLSVLGNGATGFVYNGSFRPGRYLQLLQQYGVQVLCCTPTEYRIMAKMDGLDQYDLSLLRSAVSAGEPLNQEVINKFQEQFNITIRDGYGQTESTLIIGNLRDTPLRTGSMGKSIAPGLVEVVDEDGIPLAPGQVGDIAVRADLPALFHTYYHDPERKLASVHGDYFVTGDRARKDEDGYFWFEGRGDDIIISSGYTIGPFEVEEALMKHDSVQECAAVASPDEIRGHVVKAFIVLKAGVEGSPELVKELQHHVKTWTAPYKYPRKIEFIQELPKTSSGKIRRVELRDLEKQSVL